MTTKVAARKRKKIGSISVISMSERAKNEPDTHSFYQNALVDHFALYQSFAHSWILGICWKSKCKKSAVQNLTPIKYDGANNFVGGFAPVELGTK